MSKIGKKEIHITKSINIEHTSNAIFVSGFYGSLKLNLRKCFLIKLDNKKIYIKNLYNKKHKKTRALWGLTRSLINNMVVGASKSFYKILKIYGVGYKAFLKEKNTLILNLGYSNDILYNIPENVILTCLNNNAIKIVGCNKQLVGQVASDIRNLRKPDPYKGKGIRYNKETINIKENKKK